jgi:hypothetical protein
VWIEAHLSAPEVYFKKAYFPSTWMHAFIRLYLEQALIMLQVILMMKKHLSMISEAE